MGDYSRYDYNVLAQYIQDDTGLAHWKGSTWMTSTDSVRTYHKL